MKKIISYWEKPTKSRVSMKHNVYLIVPFMLATLVSFSQRPIMELRFTAVDSVAWVPLDSIKVMNRTQGGDTVLYYPDTVLVLDNTVGIPENQQDLKRLTITGVYPNPSKDHSTITFQIPGDGEVSIVVSDILGRIAARAEQTLKMGQHSFWFTPREKGLYLVTIQWNEQNETVKVLSTASGRASIGTLKYLETGRILPTQVEKQTTRLFTFIDGDELLYIGYINGMESAIAEAPKRNSDYTFQYVYNVPCLGAPTITYKGQVYNTVQIFSQCWFKENLNVGTMIPGMQFSHWNSTTEKHCYDDDTSNCTIHGGLYEWNETMDYTGHEGARGICPAGWHIPTDEEWKILAGAADDVYGIGETEWENRGYIGYNAGNNLKSIDSWYLNSGGSDLLGFSGLAGGYLTMEPSGLRHFEMKSYNGIWWSSTNSEASNYYCGWFYFLGYAWNKAGRDDDGQQIAFSIRCIRDEEHMRPAILTFTAVNNTNYIQLDSIRVINRTKGEETLLYGDDTTLVIPQELIFNPGDELLYVGYFDTLQSGIVNSPVESQTFTFQFAYNIPCPETPTVNYGEQVYNTVQIFSQCWLKENLNIGTMITATEEMSDNGILEKYCYQNEQGNCNEYGGYYQWDEMMQYATQEGAQGICPSGWHIPTDEEWKVLEGAVDSQYDIGDPEWDLYWDYRGHNAGTHLKATSGWQENGNGSNLYGFSAIAAGSPFGAVGYYSSWWLSVEYEDFDAWYHLLAYNRPETGKGTNPKIEGYSVRCLRDEPYTSIKREVLRRGSLQ